MVAARTPNISQVPTAVRSVQARTTRKPKRPAARRKAAPVSWEAKLRPELAPRVVEDSRRGGAFCCRRRGWSARRWPPFHAAA